MFHFNKKSVVPSTQGETPMNTRVEGTFEYMYRCRLEKSPKETLTPITIKKNQVTVVYLYK